jgi:hypothetical protein
VPEIAKEPIFDHHAAFNLGTVSMTGALVTEKSIENVEISLPSLWYSDEIYNGKKKLQEYDTMSIPPIIETPLLFDRLETEVESNDFSLDFKASTQSHGNEETSNVMRIPMSTSLFERLKRIEEASMIMHQQDRSKADAWFKDAEVRVELFRLDEGRGKFLFLN